jgi:AraC family chemosensory pili system transcriptional regulator ChpD
MHDRLVVVVPPLQPFGRAAAVPFVSVHLYFRCAWPVARDALHVVPVADVLTRHLYDFAGAMEHGHDHIAACTATGLIALVLAQIPALPVSRDQAIARLVLAWQQLPLSDLPNNSMVAQQFGMTDDGFIRRFRREVGCTPGQWQRQYRLRHAARLLRAGLPLKAILAECQWKSRSQFTAAFKAMFGLTPGAWQRQRLDDH